jgi:hypothetical protein
MLIPLRVKAFFRALQTTVRGLIERITAGEEGYRYIQFRDSSYGLFLRFRDQEFQIGSGALEMTLVDLSLDEVRTLFVSIASACEGLEETKADFGEMSWTTHARLNQKRPDEIFVRITGSHGRGTLGLSRRRVLSACEEFFAEFGKQ